MYLFNTPFLDNEFTTEYFSIISNAVNRNNYNSYVEKHHIIPKCMGGKDNKNNLIFLTAYEHFKCHQLLLKITDGNNKYKLTFAYHKMVSSHSGNQSRYIPTEEEYQEAKDIMAQSVRDSRYVYDPKTGKEKKPHYSEVEKYLALGYLEGQSPDHKKNNSIHRKGKISIYHPKTQECLCVDKEELSKYLDMGYLKGWSEELRKNHKNSHQGKKWIHNPISKEERCLNETKRIKLLSEGYIFGRLPIQY